MTFCDRCRGHAGFISSFCPWARRFPERFCVDYVGRSDTDVKLRLRNFSGSGSLFKYGYFATSEAAFQNECELFHVISPPRTFAHPGRPKGTRECPCCRIFVRSGRAARCHRSVLVQCRLVAVMPVGSADWASFTGLKHQGSELDALVRCGAGRRGRIRKCAVWGVKRAAVGES